MFLVYIKVNYFKIMYETHNNVIVRNHYRFMVRSTDFFDLVFSSTSLSTAIRLHYIFRNSIPNNFFLFCVKTRNQKWADGLPNGIENFSDHFLTVFVPIGLSTL